MGKLDWFSKAPGIKGQELDFYNKYITSSEICGVLGVTRTALHSAIKRGAIKKPLKIPHMHSSIWIRSEIGASLDNWNIALMLRRGELKG